MTSFQFGNQIGQTRRDFLRTASVAGLAATASVLGLPMSSLGNTPKRGGHFRLGIAEGATTDRLNPATMSTAVEFNVTAGQLRNTLVEVDADANAVPDLATSWEPSEGGAKWIFKLREGVEFHNGKTMTSDDAVYSINYHRDENSNSAVKTLLEEVAELRGDGPNTLVFTLNSANADFPYVLSDYHFQIFPAGTTDAEFDNGIGTGGYVLESFRPGVEAVVRRNPNYWKENRAHFDAITTVAINDTTARTNALRSNEIDVMNRPDIGTLDRLEAVEGIEVTKTPSKRHFTMPMRSHDGPFTNNNLRLAMKYAIDRQDLLQRILRGYGELGNDTPINSAYRFYDPSIPQRSYDPEKAMFHLKRADAVGAKIQLHASNAPFGEAIDLATLVREQVRNCGIDLEIVREPDDGFWSEVWMQKNWTVSQWFGRPTTDMMFTIGYSKGAPWNESYWHNERFNDLLVKARSELDDSLRREMYSEMQWLVHDEGASVVPLFSHQLLAHHERVAHGPIAGNAELDGLRISERWWFHT